MLFPGKKRAPEEQNRDKPERIEQIGQVRGPVGDTVGDAWETGKDIAQKEADNCVEDHCTCHQPNGDDPGSPQPETNAGGDVEQAKQERIFNRARERAGVHF
jgi:hypothetical protein